MSFENPLTFVRALKGAPASVLLALLFNRRPMTNRELQRWTNYSEDTVTGATRLLLDLGWISALGSRGPWTLASGRQLPLTEAQNPKISGAPLSSSIVETMPSQVKEKDEGKEDENVVRSLHALYDAGIHEPTAGRLARLPHVNPEYIAAHIEQANAQGFTLGIAIYRIEHAWPLPRAGGPQAGAAHSQSGSRSRGGSRVSVEARIRKFLGEDNER